MKSKIVILIMVFIGCYKNYAQEVKIENVADSTQLKMIALEKSRAEEKVFLETQLKDQKKDLKKQEKIEEKTKDEKEALENEKDKIKDEQRKIEKQQREIDQKKEKLDDAKKLVEKRNDKLTDANKDLVKKRERFEKLKIKGKLTPVEIEEWNVKITKQQLKVKQIEEDIAKANDKLSKLQ